MHLDIVILAMGMWVVTFVPRWLPVFFLSDRKLPDWLQQVLDMIPVALLSAIVFPSLFVKGDSLLFTKTELLAAVPTLFIAWTTRSLIGTILGGMVIFWLVEKYC